MENAVYNYRGDPSTIVEINTTWFLWFNTVLMAFAMTFIVHANCLYNAVVLLKRHPRQKLFVFSVVQNMCAVACHISRVTDYFFLTDCHAKPFHNYFQYWVSLSIMDLIVVYRDINRLERLVRVNKSFSYTLWVILGIIPTLAKAITMFLTIISLDGSMGQFAICNLALNDRYFDLSHWTWIIYHCFLLIFHLFILSLVKHEKTFLTRKQPYMDEALDGDYGTCVLIVADVTTITCYLALLLGSFTPGIPDVILQCLWATKSKCTVEMLDSYALYIEEDQEHISFGKPNKFFSMSTGTDMDLEGQTAYRSQTDSELSNYKNLRNIPKLDEEITYDSQINISTIDSNQRIL